jgi:hypothetical protein
MLQTTVSIVTLCTGINYEGSCLHWDPTGGQCSRLPRIMTVQSINISDPTVVCTIYSEWLVSFMCMAHFITLNTTAGMTVAPSLKASTSEVTRVFSRPSPSEAYFASTIPISVRVLETVRRRIPVRKKVSCMSISCMDRICGNLQQIDFVLRN